MVFEKYVPKTGSPGEVDVRYLTVTEPDGPAPTFRSIALGTGAFTFHRASWEEMPTQYPIVTALASLPLEGFGNVSRFEASGGGDGGGQRRLAL
jgi:hypothetical protein